MASVGFKHIHWLALAALLLSSLLQAETPDALKIPGVDPRFRVAQDYFTGLLQKALIRGANGRPVPALLEQQIMEQERATRELMRGRLLDVYWMGSNSFREANLRAIKIPLTRGLLGYRRFIIANAKESRFGEVRSLQDLKSMVACQGMDWPDTKVLRHAGLRVRELALQDTIFKGLSNGLCDYYPRGYFEIDSDLHTFKPSYPLITHEKTILLHYPESVYFFVNRAHEDWAQWIEAGLNRMIDSGEFLEFMRQHPLTASSFPLQLGHYQRVFELTNPDLPPDTDFRNPRYWFQAGDFIARSNASAQLAP